MQHNTVNVSEYLVPAHTTTGAATNHATQTQRRTRLTATLHTGTCRLKHYHRTTHQRSTACAQRRPTQLRDASSTLGRDRVASTTVTVPHATATTTATDNRHAYSTTATATQRQRLRQQDTTDHNNHDPAGGNAGSHQADGVVTGGRRGRRQAGQPGPYCQ